MRQIGDEFRVDPFSKEELDHVPAPVNIDVAHIRQFGVNKLAASSHMFCGKVCANLSTASMDD